MDDLENKEEKEETEECIDWEESRKQGKIVKTTRKKEKKEVEEYDLFFGESHIKEHTVNNDTDNTIEKYLYEEIEHSFFSKIMDLLLILAILALYSVEIINKIFQESILDENFIIMTLFISDILVAFVATTKTAIGIGVWPRRKKNRGKTIASIIVSASILTMTTLISLIIKNKFRYILLLITLGFIIYGILLFIIIKIIAKKLDIKNG